MSWLIQIANCQCRLSTTNLVADGLYVTVPQFDQLALPKSFNDMDCMQPTLKALLTMEQSIRKIADLLPAAYAKREQLEEHFGRSTIKADYTDWLRGTFFTPPGGHEPRLPIDLFTRRPSDLGSKLTKIKHNDQLPDQLANSGNVPDKFGWLYVPNLKKYYNTTTKTYSNQHPFHRSRNHIPPTSSSSASSSTEASSSK